MTLRGPAIAREDLRACRALLRRGPKSFSAAYHLLPRSIRPAVAATYAFCRVADDMIKRADANPRAHAELLDRLVAIYAGKPRGDPVDRAFAAVVAHHRIPIELPAALIEGLGWDAEVRRYETHSQLRAYAVRVASTVGMMVTLILGERRPSVLARACDLGVALQLTNIARDVGEDARAGRIYLPLERLWAFDVDPDAFLAKPEFEPGIASIVEELLLEADVLYARAEQGIATLPRGSRRAIRAARLVYADIGRVIHDNGWNSVSVRAVTTWRRKQRLLLRAWRRCFGERLAEVPPDPPLKEAAFLVEAVAAVNARGGALLPPETARAMG